jgi:hypothetical protein
LLDEFLQPLEDLDDEEYGLPSLEYTPTLDEILEDALDADDDGVNGGGGGQVAWTDAAAAAASGTVAGHSAPAALLESLSVASGGSGGSRSQHSRSSRPTRHHHGHCGRQEKSGAGGGGGIVRHVILKGISAQMVSAAKRVAAGHPSAMAASSLIAVGTFHGFILVFDSQQHLKWSLGGKSLGDDFGAVSALSFNPDCSRLLVGFAKGQLVEFDVLAGKLLQVIIATRISYTSVRT